MGEQNSQLSTLQRPTSNDPEVWKVYWARQGQEWRTEPEIDAHRQDDLGRRRAIVPSIEGGIYPFKGIKLNRADVEWLLAAHEDGRGPLDWSDESQREREGLDLRGADLRKENLAGLPLARFKGGLDREDWNFATSDQRDAASLLLQEANLVQTHLEGAILGGAHLERTSLFKAHLQHAALVSTHMEGALLRGAHLEGARLRATYFNSASNLAYASLCSPTDGPVTINDVRWGGVNLTPLDWTDLQILGNETEARRSRMPDGKRKNNATRLNEYQRAVRAYHQLARILEEQGVTEDADRFAYRARLLQRRVLRLEGLVPNVNLGRRFQKLGSYFFQLFLDLLAGYGYKPTRTVIWYLLVICGFALVYYHMGPAEGHVFSLDGALVFSVTSFHGRGFFPGGLRLEDGITTLAAIEAVVGLFIEISFIATFTQRFFGR